MALGLLQLVALGFPGNKFRGEIVPELDAITAKGLARIIDLVFVYRDEDGTTATVQFSDLSDDERSVYGITGSLVGLGASGTDGPAADAALGGEITLEGGLGLTAEDVEEIAQEVPNGSSALIILLEHLWSVPFKQAVANADGRLLG